MDYKNFIDEIRVYLEEAKSLINSDQLEKDQAYRKWRHNLTDLINRIESKGYSVNSSIKKRRFYSTRLSATPNDKIEAFIQGIQDTIIELEALISNFDKYGDPGKLVPENQSLHTPLELPQKITLSWLKKNVPIELWFKVIGVLIAVLAFGVFVGQSQLYKETIAKLYTKSTQIEHPVSTPNSKDNKIKKTEP